MVEISATDRLVLRALAEFCGGLTANEIAALIELPLNQVEESIVYLKTVGFMQPIGFRSDC
jgi:Fic family protein